MAIVILQYLSVSAFLKLTQCHMSITSQENSGGGSNPVTGTDGTTMIKYTHYLLPVKLFLTTAISKYRVSFFYVLIALHADFYCGYITLVELFVDVVSHIIKLSSYGRDRLYFHRHEFPGSIALHIADI